MSTTADATVTITCPDWCDYDAQTHAAQLYDLGGQCVHSGLLAAVDDPSGQGPEWSPWKPAETLRSALIDVGVTVTPTPDGRPTATPGIRLASDVHTTEQIEALIPELLEAIRLAKEQVPAKMAAD